MAQRKPMREVQPKRRYGAMTAVSRKYMRTMMMGKKTSVAALACVTIALFAGTITPAGAQQVCDNGLEGIQSSSLNACCVAECGLCGGLGCTPPITSNLTSADCCATEIVESGTFCDMSGAAPCIVTTDPAPDDSVCANGKTGVQDPNTDVCCPLVCGDSCGGVGCGSIASVADSANQCCATNILDSGRVCSDDVAAPCAEVASAADNSTACSNGLAGIEDPVKLICCDAACGQCGGPGCGNIPGLTGLKCCSDEIEASGQLCSVTGAAPCRVDPPDFAPSMCPNGIPGVQDGTVCCAEECNLRCGGVGCGSILGTNGADDCCSDTILLAGVPCGAGVAAPCIMQEGTFTFAPMAAPTVPPPAGATPAPGAVATGTLAPAAAGAGTLAPAAVATGTLAPAAAGAGGVTEAPVAGTRDFDTTGAPAGADGSRDADPGDATPSPADNNGDGVVDGKDGVDTNGDGVIDQNDGVDTNGDGVIDGNDGVDTNGDGIVDDNDGIDFNEDGVIDSSDVPEDLDATPAPLSADADVGAASGNGAMSAVNLPAVSVYAGVLGVAMAVGGLLLL